jgi:hypothetical protein
MPPKALPPIASTFFWTWIERVFVPRLSICSHRIDSNDLAIDFILLSILSVLLLHKIMNKDGKRMKEL